jgi:hypothetical protein
VSRKQFDQKWLSMKNRSTRRSTPRHPIAMSSTVKPPDPMKCALVVILLPESRAHACHVQNTLFPGTYWVHAGCWCVRAVPACGVRRCGVGTRRESGQRHACGEAVPGTTGGRRTLVGSPFQQRGHVWSLRGRARGGLVDAVSSRSAGSGMRRRLGWCGDRWLFRGFCAGHRLTHRAADAWGADTLQKGS